MLGITELLPEPNTGYLSREKVHEFKLKKKKSTQVLESIYKML